MQVVLLSAVLVSVCLYTPVAGVRCRSCSKALRLEDCSGFRDCDDDEVCYMEERINTAGLFAYYEGGCRSRALCSSSSVGSGRKRQLVDPIACTSCCNSVDYCNDKLCSFTSNPNLTHCYACDGEIFDGGVPSVFEPHKCTTLDVCQADEMCFAEMQGINNKIKHVTKCLNIRICKALMGFVLNQNVTVPAPRGKRVINACSVCCGDNYCNQDACIQIQQRLRKMYHDGELDPTTLKKIPKSSK